MADERPHVTTSADGRWELRYTNTYAVNEVGYGNGSWSYELVERATGRIAQRWSGGGSQSPWSESSFGVKDVRWDGNELVVLDNEVEQRVTPA